MRTLNRYIVLDYLVIFLGALGLITFVMTAGALIKAVDLMARNLCNPGAAYLWRKRHLHNMSGLKNILLVDGDARDAAALEKQLGMLPGAAGVTEG